MRKLLLVLSAIGLVLATAVPAGAAKKGPLKVATNLPGPGFFNGGDTVDTITSGYEYELAKEIAKRLGYSGITLVNVSFDGLVAGKASGFDVAFSQVTITKDRAKVVDFSVPYFLSDQGIIVRKGTKVDKSNLKKLQWGAQSTTTGETFLNKKIKPDKQPRSYSELSAAFAALQAQQVDAVIIDTSIALGEVQQSNGAFAVVGQFKTGESYGAVFQKGSKLKKQVDKVIKALKADGTLAKLSAKYLKPAFGGDPSKVPYLKP